RLALLGAFSGRWRRRGRGSPGETTRAETPETPKETLNAQPQETLKETLNAPVKETLKPSRGPKRPRSAKPLWAPEPDAEKRAVFAQVTATLEWANKDFGASFPVAASARDTLRYPF